MQGSDMGIGPEGDTGIAVFDYPAGPALPAPLMEAFGGGELGQGEPEDRRGHAASPVLDALQRSEFEERLAEEARRSFEAGRACGRQEGRAAEREAQAAALTGENQQRMEQAARLVESFSRERDSYLQAVEYEVVKLALAVAARILRREAQMDPLLLTGAVRVALGQLSASTQVRLRVPPGELDLWSEAVGLLPNLAVRPVVLADDGMRLGECVVETEMGSVDLGVRAQLAEIERGFFDRSGAPVAARSESLVVVEQGS